MVSSKKTLLVKEGPTVVLFREFTSVNYHVRAKHALPDGLAILLGYQLREGALTIPSCGPA